MATMTTAEEYEPHTLPFEQFWWRLTDLALGEKDPTPIVDEALLLLIRAARADLGYIELYNQTGARTFARGFARPHLDLDRIRSRISPEIIKYVVGTKTIVSTIARSEPRFENYDSVVKNNIGAVLVAPVGTNPVGVIYLQGHGRPGEFWPRDQNRIGHLARKVRPYVAFLVQNRRYTFDDLTRAFERRTVLQALAWNKWNVESASRELQIDLSETRRYIADFGLVPGDY